MYCGCSIVAEDCSLLRKATWGFCWKSVLAPIALVKGNPFPSASLLAVVLAGWDFTHVSDVLHKRSASPFLMQSSGRRLTSCFSGSASVLQQCEDYHFDWEQGADAK